MSGTVVLYIHALVGGGGERLWASLATALSERGYNVVLAEDYHADENRGLVGENVRIVTLGGGHWHSTRALARLLAAEKPVTALAAIGSANLKLAVADVLAGRPSPIVLTYHGFDDWKLGKLGFLAYGLLPLLSRLAAKVVGVSDGLSNSLTTQWRARRDRVVTVANPVFTPSGITPPDAGELAKRPNQLLAVGRLTPEKDYPTLFDAMQRLRHSDATLTILGSGPLEPQLREDVARRGLSSRVTFAGYLREPWAAYTKAKCFVLPSTREAFGNVIVEALAFGLPVVATATAGASQILDGGRYGRLVPISDAAALADAIDATLDDPGPVEQRIARAEDFSMAARVPDYISLIEAIRRDR